MAAIVDESCARFPDGKTSKARAIRQRGDGALPSTDSKSRPVVGTVREQCGSQGIVKSRSDSERPTGPLGRLLNTPNLAPLLDQAPVGFVVLRGPDFVYEYVNPAFQALAAPEVPLLGHPFGWRSGVPELVTGLRHVWETGEEWRVSDYPVRFERIDGKPEQAYFSFVCQKVRCHRPPDAILAFVIDTTERVYAKERSVAMLHAARSRAAELEAVIDTMLEGVIAYDRDHRLTLVNATAKRILKDVGLDPALYEHPGALARTLQLTRPDGSPIDFAELPVPRAFAGHACRRNLRFWNPVKRRHGFATIGAVPIRGCDGEIAGVVSVGSDVTEVTELDRLKDEFIRVIAHELKTPITIMKCCAETLTQTLGPTVAPAQARMLQSIGRASNRINRIMSELLDAQQIDLGLFTLTIDRLDLGALVESIVDRVAATAPRHRVRVVEMQAVAVSGDDERLREVMRVLLDNAVRYSPDGGDVDVTVRRVDGAAEVSVRDHGVGIPEDRRERLFQRFYRAHTGTPYDYGGTGLGLYVARYIVERHGGRIVYEPADGGGSRFTMRLPIGAAA